MDVLRAMRFLWVAGLLLAGCLQTVPDTLGPVQPSSGNGGTTGVTANSAGSGSSGGHVGGTASAGSAGSVTTGGSGGCTYPGQSAGGTVFPYFSLGVGWVSTSAAVSSAAAPTPEPTALLQLHCSGARYALINVSAAWDMNNSLALATSLSMYTTAWLAEGGLILTILEQGPNNGAAATPGDLSSWATQYGTNYSLVNDPSESALSNLGITSWPALYIVRLSDMVIVNSQLGPVGSFLGTYSGLLAQ